MPIFQFLLIVPFISQGMAMAVDEFYFHRRRGLPRWERIGHPLDTLSVMICYIYILNQAFSADALLVYIGLAGFSCVLITKDEMIHQDHCSKWETWLHAVLFVLHPLTFVAAGFLWSQNSHREWILGQTVLIILFMLYQIFYWSLPWQKTE
jgi:hypothetical protein